LNPVRLPAVAGRFYPGHPSALSTMIESFIDRALVPSPAIGVVVPHAGYIYSGHVAGAIYSRVAVPSRTIILCPNHTGFGVPLSIMSKGSWQTPLGDIQIDNEMAIALMAANPDLEAQMAASNIEITRPMADAIIESDTPHTLIAHLLANPAEVDRIVALSPLQQFRALARLDAQLETPASSGASGSPVSKPKTAAQPPISPVSGSHPAPTGGAPDPATCSQEEWDAYYNAQEKEARKSGRRR